MVDLGPSLPLRKNERFLSAAAEALWLFEITHQESETTTINRVQNLLKQAALELPAKGIQRVPFINGGHVFFLRPYITEFLTKQLGAPNRFLQGLPNHRPIQ